MYAPGRQTKNKLHARYSAPRTQANAAAHEVFAHHFRLPQRGGEMAHLHFLLCFYITKNTAGPILRLKVPVSFGTFGRGPRCACSVVALRHPPQTAAQSVSKKYCSSVAPARGNVNGRQMAKPAESEGRSWPVFCGFRQRPGAEFPRPALGRVTGPRRSGGSGPAPWGTPPNSPHTRSRSRRSGSPGSFP